ncbi:MAG: hypothetical protein JWM53_622 [bacterium]|nr:hypothetical protein [bacterium]
MPITINVEHEAVTLLKSPEVKAALADALRAIVREEVRSALAEQAEQLAPLAKILGCSSPAAGARLRRDPELRKLGVQIGRRVLFKRSDVEGYYRARGRM